MENINLDKVFSFLFARGYTILGQGLYRTTLIKNKCFVLKIPHSHTFESNYQEYNRFKKFGKFGDFPIAECLLIHLFDVPILKMEYVEPVNYDTYKNLKWVGFVDGAQVGKDRQNNIVAYDYH